MVDRDRKGEKKREKEREGEGGTKNIDVYLGCTGGDVNRFVNTVFKTRYGDRFRK